MSSNDYRLRTILNELRTALIPRYGVNEATIIAEWVIEDLSGFSKSALLIHGNDRLRPEQRARFEHYRKELLSGRPVQYVLGECFFFGLRIKVNESVLIPRPETEELVSWCLEKINSQARERTKPSAILDVGTGSGCIALALKNNLPEAQVYGVDISALALATASLNAAAHDLPVTFFEKDILDPRSWAGLPEVDFLISNPPYISNQERPMLSATVRDYEPPEALFVTNDDPLQFYKGIAALADAKLKAGGLLFLETHSVNARDTRAYYASLGWEGDLKQDFQGNDRMLCLYKM